MAAAFTRAEPAPGSAIPALLTIADSAWREALQTAKEYTIPADTVVMRPGDPCKDFLMVLQGRVRIYRTDENGREIVLYRVVTGEICVMTLRHLSSGRDYSAEAITEEETRLLAVPRASFQHAMARSEAFRDFILSETTRRLDEVMRLVEQITFQKLDLRLACLLGQLTGLHHTHCIQITHQEVARELGTTREVASRLLKEFERKGCIRLQRGCIEILSPEALARLDRS
jgi:CRP/FNR family transcriptional regulator